MHRNLCCPLVGEFPPCVRWMIFPSCFSRPSGITPSPRWLHSAGVRTTNSSYLQRQTSPTDIETAEVWVFGGQGQGGALYGDLHVLTLSVEDKSDQAADFSTKGNRSASDLSLEGMHWSPLQWSMATNSHDHTAESRPSPRAGHCCVMLQEQSHDDKTKSKPSICQHDSSRNTHMLVFGGLAQTIPRSDEQLSRNPRRSEVCNELWLLECRRIQWQKVCSAQGSPPCPRWTASCCVVHQKSQNGCRGAPFVSAFFNSDVIVFGGWASPESKFFNDLHILSLRPIDYGEKPSSATTGKTSLVGLAGKVDAEYRGISAAAGTTFTWSTPMLAPGPQPHPRCQSACWWVAKSTSSVNEISVSEGRHNRNDISDLNCLCRGYLLVYGGACHTLKSNQTSEYGDRVHDLEDCWMFEFRLERGLKQALHFICFVEGSMLVHI